MRKSLWGLRETALPIEDQQKLRQELEPHIQRRVQYQALRTRQSAARQFVSFHLPVPGRWTVQGGQRLLENTAADTRHVLPSAVVYKHLESLSDPASWEDASLERAESTSLEALAKNPQQTSDGVAQSLGMKR